MQDNLSLWPSLVGGIIFMAIWLPASYHHALTFTPRGVVKRLRKADGPVTMRVPWLGGSWNPAKAARIQNQLVGPGRATYRLESANEVSVHYRPKWGKPQHFKGPIPQYVDQVPVRVLPRRARWFLASYGLFLVLGAGIGAFVAGGDASNRATGATIGFFVSMVAASFLSTALAGIMSFRHHSTQGSKPTIGVEDATDQASDPWKRVETNERTARRYLDEHEHHWE